MCGQECGQNPLHAYALHPAPFVGPLAFLLFFLSSFLAFLLFFFVFVPSPSFSIGPARAKCRAWALQFWTTRAQCRAQFFRFANWFLEPTSGTIFEATFWARLWAPPYLFDSWGASFVALFWPHFWSPGFRFWPFSDASRVSAFACHQQVIPWRCPCHLPFPRCAPMAA